MMLLVGSAQTPAQVQHKPFDVAPMSVRSEETGFDSTPYTAIEGYLLQGGGAKSTETPRV
jgi:hypothetical protein